MCGSVVGTLNYSFQSQEQTIESADAPPSAKGCDVAEGRWFGIAWHKGKAAPIGNPLPFPSGNVLGQSAF